MTDEELGKAIWKKIGSLYFEATLGVAARELLAKPVATREAIKEALRPMWLTQDPHSVRTLDMWVSAAAYALSRFAPPRQRMMIEGMAASDIYAKMQEGNTHNTFWHCASVAHRLATTPAPEVDADARAKALAYEYHKRANANVRSSADLYWNDLNNASQDGWRAVAAMEKGNG